MHACVIQLQLLYGTSGRGSCLALLALRHSHLLGEALDLIKHLPYLRHHVLAIGLHRLWEYDNDLLAELRQTHEL